MEVCRRAKSATRVRFARSAPTISQEGDLKWPTFSSSIPGASRWMSPVWRAPSVSSRSSAGSGTARDERLAARACARRRFEKRARWHGQHRCRRPERLGSRRRAAFDGAGRSDRPGCGPDSCRSRGGWNVARPARSPSRAQPAVAGEHRGRAAVDHVEAASCDRLRAPQAVFGVDRVAPTANGATSL